MHRRWLAPSPLAITISTFDLAGVAKAIAAQLQFDRRHRLNGSAFQATPADRSAWDRYGRDLPQEVERDGPSGIGSASVKAKPPDFAALWQPTHVEAMPRVWIGDCAEAIGRAPFSTRSHAVG